ncbi:MAG: hypothetical protein JOY59_02140 [Candidatus Eremiobacteraeota bacterium]|nr:hypothetical protein [Candidatus Eremiobacteraeota bacterium]
METTRERPADIAVWRLYLLRALYLLIAVGQGSLQFPKIVHPVPGEFWHGVGVSFLAGLALLCLIGLRYPLQMLPLLLYEFTWKTIWLLSVAVPRYLTHNLNADTADNIFDIGLGVVLCPIVIPWDYVYTNYIKRPGDRWK